MAQLLTFSQAAQATVRTAREQMSQAGGPGPSTALLTRHAKHHTGSADPRVVGPVIEEARRVMAEPSEQERERHRPAIVTLGHGGKVAVLVIGETPKRYRVRFEETAQGWQKGQEWLAPKHAVDFDDEDEIPGMGPIISRAER